MQQYNNLTHSLASDIELMTGSRPSIYWLICWKYISPLTMLIIVVASLTKIAVEGSGYFAWVSELGTTRQLEWPPWAQLVIAVLVLVAVLWIPAIALARYYTLLLMHAYLVLHY